jgi:hypothetical protein
MVKDLKRNNGCKLIAGWSPNKMDSDRESLI